MFLGSQHFRGRRACWSSGMGTRKSDKHQLLSWTCTNQTTSWLMHNLSTFGARTSHGQTRTHKTHHGPNLGEATTFPLIVYSVVGHGTSIQMTLFPGLPSGSPKIPKVGILTPKMGIHLGVWGFIPSHSFALPGAWNVTLGLPSWPAPLQAFALVASPRLGLRQLPTHRKPTSIPRMGQFGHPHWEDDMAHNYAHGPSMFDPSRPSNNNISKCKAFWTCKIKWPPITSMFTTCNIIPKLEPKPEVDNLFHELWHTK
jgi:hypothetical protein